LPGLIEKLQKIIEILNDVLGAELAAINQYFLHAELCHSWGFERLYLAVRKESIDEMKHAEWLMERILALEAMPEIQGGMKVTIGKTVSEQLKVDLKLEIGAVDRLNEGIRTVGEIGDNGTVELLKKILVNEEEHIEWLEAQIELIKQVGETKYLATQIHSE